MDSDAATAPAASAAATKASKAASASAVSALATSEARQQLLSLSSHLCFLSLTLLCETMNERQLGSIITFFFFINKKLK